MAGIAATYISATSFSFSGTDYTTECMYGRRLNCDCGVDGDKIVTVSSSVWSDPLTTVTVIPIVSESLTNNLESVRFGVGIGEVGSVGTIKTMTLTVDDASAVFGNALYLEDDFHYERCDADAAITMPCTAIALESGAGSKNVLLEGPIYNTDWDWTDGNIYVSTTVGALTQSPPAGSGDQVQIVGYALDADTMFFLPNSTIVEIA